MYVSNHKGPASSPINPAPSSLIQLLSLASVRVLKLKVVVTLEAELVGTVAGPDATIQDGALE